MNGDRWLRRHVRVFAGYDWRKQHGPIAEGTVVGYIDGPSIHIRSDDGRDSTWPISLPIDIGDIVTDDQPTTEQHCVTLPYPNRSGPKTTGTCDCGWTITYGWGGHGDAADAAGEHVQQAGHARPVQAQDFGGEITVMEGLSL